MVISNSLGHYYGHQRMTAANTASGHQLASGHIRIYGVIYNMIAYKHQ